MKLNSIYHYFLWPSTTTQSIHRTSRILFLKDLDRHRDSFGHFPKLVFNVIIIIMYYDVGHHTINAAAVCRMKYSCASFDRCVSVCFAGIATRTNENESNHVLPRFALNKSHDEVIIFDFVIIFLSGPNAWPLHFCQLPILSLRTIDVRAKHLRCDTVQSRRHEVRISENRKKSKIPRPFVPKTRRIDGKSQWMVCYGCY